MPSKKKQAQETTVNRCIQNCHKLSLENAEWREWYNNNKDKINAKRREKAAKERENRPTKRLMKKKDFAKAEQEQEDKPPQTTKRSKKGFITKEMWDKPFPKSKKNTFRKGVSQTTDNDQSWYTPSKPKKDDKTETEQFELTEPKGKLKPLGKKPKSKSSSDKKKTPVIKMPSPQQAPQSAWWDEKTDELSKSQAPSVYVDESVWAENPQPVGGPKFEKIPKHSKAVIKLGTEQGKQVSHPRFKESYKGKPNTKPKYKKATLNYPTLQKVTEINKQIKSVESRVKELESESDEHGPFWITTPAGKKHDQAIKSAKKQLEELKKKL